jgi:MoaA/NifB/PqqE/SkfB family radical SAM enzyme
MNTFTTPAEGIENSASALDFVWLELTNRCNLQCVHCYAESGPAAGKTDVLTEADYLNLIEQVYKLGCRKIQFIGGEPTLNRSLPELIEAAFVKGFEFIEVFTNLTRLPDKLLTVFRQFDVAIATSFYTYNPQTHDEITNQQGSFERTTRNIRKILDAGLTLRVGIVEMELNKGDLVKTWEFLEKTGVKVIGKDRLRAIGRADGSDCSAMGELCGNCAGNILSIGPDGIVSPCIMSKQWSVGSILESSLAEIAASSKLIAIRSDIYQATLQTKEKYEMGGCNPDRPNRCNPDYGGPCNPCIPNQRCGPNSCQPSMRPKHTQVQLSI